MIYIGISPPKRKRITSNKTNNITKMYVFEIKKEIRNNEKNNLNISIPLISWKINEKYQTNKKIK